MIAVIDYDAGNIRNVVRAIDALGAESVVSSDGKEILSADRVILPGVGNFGDASKKLKISGLDQVIKEAIDRDKPFLGICLGLQLLFSDSEESPGEKGLGLIPGHVRRFPDDMGLKIPHIGWNSLSLTGNGSRLFKGIRDDEYFYFVHSYYLDCEDEGAVAGRSDYGIIFDAAVEWGNVFACQFHPEKSSKAGLRVLKNFLEL